MPQIRFDRPAPLAGHILQWVLASLPLLMMLSAVWLSFGSEAEQYAFFRQHRYQNPNLRALMYFITDWSNIAVYGVYMWLMYRAVKSGDKRGVRFIVTFAAVQLLVSALLVRVIKISVGKPRPNVGGVYNPFSFSPSYHSFPSGHTAEVTGASLPLAFGARSCLFSLGIGVLVAVVGFTRIYLSKHHVSDVFFGWVLGSFVGWCVIALTGLIDRRLENNRQGQA